MSWALIFHFSFRNSTRTFQNGFSKKINNLEKKKTTSRSPRSREQPSGEEVGELRILRVTFDIEGLISSGVNSGEERGSGGGGVDL